MNRDDIAGVLGAVRLFRGADPALLKRIAQQPRARRQTKPDEAVYEVGEPADAIFFAFPSDAGAVGPRGIVELVLPAGEAGLPGHVEHVVAGDAFGEFEFVAAGLVDGRHVRRSSARTLLACDLYRIPFAVLGPALAEAEAIRGRLIRVSMERLISALNVKTTHSLGDRDIALANWLLDAADNVGIAEGRHVRFSRVIGQREIAEALGVSRETISLRLNEWERAGLLNTGGQSQRFEILDYPRVALRAAVRKNDAPTAIAAALEEVDADLNRGDLVRARNVALDMLTFFPASPDLRHRVALAAVRAGAVREAVDVLAQSGYATGGDVDLLRERVKLGLAHPGVSPGRLFFGGGAADEVEEPGEEAADRVPTLVEDIAAIEARARKEMAFAGGAAGSRQSYAAMSAHLYQTIFAATGGAYAGINAAMMALIAGDARRSATLARKIATTLGNAPRGYWANATLGEARLLLGETKAAIAAFAVAAGQEDSSDGKRSSTRLQVRRIGAHADVPVAAVLETLPVGSVAAYSGRSFRGLDAGAQETLEKALQPRIAKALATESIRYVYGSLAAGADILIAEAALAAGCDLHVVLPFPADTFVEACVAVGDRADGWSERFRACLNRSASLASATDQPAQKRTLEAHRYRATRLAGGLALLHADALTGRSLMLVASGGPDSNRTGIAQAMREWTGAGRELVAIPTEPPTAEVDEAAPDGFAPLVFLWPVEPTADIAALCEAAAARTGRDLSLIARTSRDRRTGGAIALPDIAAALDVLAALAELCRERAAPVRVVADFGPVRDSRGQVSETAVSRLSGASDLIGFPQAAPIATMAFAAEARLEAERRVTLIPIGRSSQGPPAEGRPLAARAVYALSFAGSDLLTALAAP
jgi:CRP-like cAMP-binding protein